MLRTMFLFIVSTFVKPSTAILFRRFILHTCKIQNSGPFDHTRRSRAPITPPIFFRTGHTSRKCSVTDEPMRSPFAPSCDQLWQKPSRYTKCFKFGRFVCREKAGRVTKNFFPTETEPLRNKRSTSSLLTQLWHKMLNIKQRIHKSEIIYSTMQIYFNI